MFDPIIGKKYEIYYSGLPTPDNWAGVAILYDITEDPETVFTDYWLEFEYLRLDSRYADTVSCYDRQGWGKGCLFPLSTYQRLI